MATESFSWSKFFGGFTSLVTWAKNIQFLAWFCAIAFVGFTIYRAYFMPTNTQKQQTRIVVQQGGTLNLKQEQQQSAKERRWFVGPNFSVDRHGDYYIGITIMRSF